MDERTEQHSESAVTLDEMDESTAPASVQPAAASSDPSRQQHISETACATPICPPRLGATACSGTPQSHNIRHLEGDVKPAPAAWLIPIEPSVLDSGHDISAGLGRTHKETSFSSFRRRCHRLAERKAFTVLLITLIALNTLTLALDYPSSSAEYALVLSRLFYVWTAAFILETTIKLLGYGLRGYLRNAWDCFDGGVLVLSLVEIAFDVTGKADNTGALSLRSLRLLRVFQLAQRWPAMRKIMATVASSGGSLGHLTFILVIVIYIFAVVGVQLFGSYYQASSFPDGELPRWNMKDFPHAFMLIFRVFCGEWVEPMWGTLLVTGYSAVVFYLLAVVIGSFILLNLFLALLLGSCDTKQVPSKHGVSSSSGDGRGSNHVSPSPDEQLQHTTGGKSQITLSRSTSLPSVQSVGSTTSLDSTRVLIPQDSVDMPLLGDAAEDPFSYRNRGKMTRGQRLYYGMQQKIRRRRPKVAPSCQVSDVTLLSTSSSAGGNAVTADMASINQGNRTIFPLVRICRAVVKHRHFDRFLLCIIFWSCLMLCFEDAATDFEYV